MLVLKCRSGVPDRVCTDLECPSPSGFGPSSSAEDAMRLCRHGAFSSHVRPGQGVCGAGVQGNLLPARRRHKIGDEGLCSRESR